MKVFLKLAHQDDEVKQGVRVIIDMGTKLMFYYSLNIISGPVAVVEKSEVERIGLFIADDFKD